MQEVDEEAVYARADPQLAESFIERNRQFILRCAAKHTHKYISDSDDEWSVAMSAFSEALTLYQADKGAFLPFSELIIRRRLTDYLRSQARFAHEIAVAPSVFQGQISDSEINVGLQEAVIQKTVHEDNTDLKCEIEAAGKLLEKYGISFLDLAECSPKAEKTRNHCATIVRYLLSSPLLLSEIRRTSIMPIQAVSYETRVPGKILERHRKYIIAAVEILDGDFPGLCEYLRYIYRT